MLGQVPSFAIRGAVVAFVCGAATALLAAATGSISPGWFVGGWVLASAIGLAGGAVLLAVRGRPAFGNVFAFVLQATMIVRMFAVGGGAILSAQVGPAGLWSYVGGFASAFVPLSVYEGIWFLRASRPSGAPAFPVGIGPRADGR